jgi:hypothetical protein
MKTTIKEGLSSGNSFESTGKITWKMLKVSQQSRARLIEIRRRFVYRSFICLEANSSQPLTKEKLKETERKVSALMFMFICSPTSCTHSTRENKELTK